MAKKTRKATTKSKRKPKAIAKARGKAKKKMKAAAPAKKKTVANRRKHRRFEPKSLWVTERNGDYQFVIPARDISEGGVFLAGRLKSEQPASRLTLHLGSQGSIELAARQVHDRILSDAIGTGYQFTEVSQLQAKALKSYLRNLD